MLEFDFYFSGSRKLKTFCDGSLFSFKTISKCLQKWVYNTLALWNSLFCAVLSKIWEERNARIFKASARPYNEILDPSIFNALFCCKEFQFLKDHNLNFLVANCTSFVFLWYGPFVSFWIISFINEIVSYQKLKWKTKCQRYMSVELIWSILGPFI